MYEHLDNKKGIYPMLLVQQRATYRPLKTLKNIALFTIAVTLFVSSASTVLLAAPGDITFDGFVGQGSGRTSLAYGMATDPDGNVYVVDTNNSRIAKFNSSNTIVLEFGSAGTGNGQFNTPFGIAVDSTGSIYVSDWNNRIQKFSSAGVVNIPYSTSDASTDLSLPAGLAVDTDDNLYVVDMANARIKKFNSSGVVDTQFSTSDAGSGAGQFVQAINIAIDSSGDIYVLDGFTGDVKKYSSNGTLIPSFAITGLGATPLNLPSAIAIDTNNNIYIADDGNDRIVQLTQAGAVLQLYGTQGNGDGEFQSIRSITISNDGKLYAADQTLNRITRLSIEQAAVVTPPVTQPGAGSADPIIPLAPNTGVESLEKQPNPAILYATLGIIGIGASITAYRLLRKR